MSLHKVTFLVLLLLAALASAWPAPSLDTNTTTHLGQPPRILETHLPARLDRPTHKLDTNLTTHLNKRQCVRRSAADNAGFDCDFRLPSVDDIVEQLRNPHNGQGVNTDRPAVFVSTVDIQTA
jgi:hypothetical protein